MNSRIKGTVDFHAQLLTYEYRNAIERLGSPPSKNYHDNGIERLRL